MHKLMDVKITLAHAPELIRAGIVAILGNFADFPATAGAMVAVDSLCADVEASPSQNLGSVKAPVFMYCPYAVVIKGSLFVMPSMESEEPVDDSQADAAVPFLCA